MEIEAHPKDLNGTKTSLRLRVVYRSKIDQQKCQLLCSEILNGQTRNGNPVIEQDPNGFEDDDDLIKVILEGVWRQSHIADDSVIHLVKPRYEKKTDSYIVDNSSGLVIIEPDSLLTCTAVASTLWCERKTWLNHVFLGQVGSNRAMLVGTLVHEVFQHALKNKIVDIEVLTKFLDEQLDDATIMLEIYSIEMHINDIRKEAIEYITSVIEWLQKYMLAGPPHSLTNDSEMEVKVKEVRDIEENVWSTKYGLKGKVDVTGLVRVHDKKTSKFIDKILPLELKTGKPRLSDSHQAQVSLYSMMLEDRYSEFNQGLVIYLKGEAAMHNVQINHNIKRDLVQRRNDLNYYMKSYYFGPGVIDSHIACRNCERLTECIVMNDIYEHDIMHYPNIANMVKGATGHLSSKFIQFFQKYHEKLVASMTRSENSSKISDNGDSKRTFGSFWTYSSAEAEAHGAGFGKLQASVIPDSKHSLIKFTRHPEHKENLLGHDKSTSQDNPSPSSKPSKKLKIDDFFKPQKKVDEVRYKPFDQTFNYVKFRMAISRDDETSSMDSQNSSTALAIGFMQEFKEDYFILKIYEGALDFIRPNLMYRVDRIEKKSNPDIERLVLVRLLAKEDPHSDTIRQLITDPKYVPMETVSSVFLLPENFEELNELDSELQDRVCDAICTHTYYVFNETMLPPRPQIHKMVSILTRIICAINRTVLIVAQNLDHLVELMRLLQRTSRIRFIIIDDGKSKQARFQFASNLVKVPQDDNMELAKKFDSYIRQLEQPPVVMTSYAMSVGGLQFTRRNFHYCVAYDCNTTELLLGLSPMFSCDHPILIDVKGASMGEQSLGPDEISLGDHLRRLRQPETKIPTDPLTVDLTDCD